MIKKVNLKLIVPGIFAIVLVGCNSPGTDQQTTSSAEQVVADTQSTNLPETDMSSEVVAAPDSLPATEDSPEVAAGRLAGAHSLSLQWISWDKPGTITFKTIGENKYAVEGEQLGAKGDECPECYLRVKGTITEVSPRKLSFTGTIETSVYHIQDGAPCVKEGTFDFLATGSRKYWRSQNQQGCEGVTDYVDIYF
jgi:hypothetical protein